MTKYIFESPIGLYFYHAAQQKMQRLVKEGAPKGEKIGREKWKISRSMQERNEVLGKRDRGKGKIADEEEMQIKIEIRK